MTAISSNVDRERKIDRVRKLLSLARDKNANEHEAAMALARAQAQMEAEGISEAEVLAQGASEAFSATGARSKVPAWENRLAAAVAAAFGCDVIHHTGAGKWSYVGIDPLPEIAIYAFDILRRQCLDARRAYVADKLKRVKSRASKIRRADLFCDGWIETAISKARRLARPRDHEAAILAFKEVNYPSLVKLMPFSRSDGRTLREYEMRDFMRGRLTGDGAELNPGVGVKGRGVGRIGRG